MKTTITSQRLQSLFKEIGKVITSSLESPKIIDAIMKQVHTFFQPRNWSLLRVDAKTQELYFVVAKGIDIKQLSSVRLKVGEGIAGYVAQTGKAMHVKDAQTNPYFSKKVDKITGFKTRSIIAVPIIFNHQVLGVIELINAFNDRAFTARELEILKTIADFSAIALTHALAYERLLWLAIHDSLTGLYSLGYLNQLLELLQNTDRPKNKSSYAIAAWIDINDLKKINDYYGHHMGNKVLIRTGQLLTQLMDKKTTAIRFGGDEFIVIMMPLNKNKLKKEVALLQKKLAKYTQEINPSSGFAFGIAYGPQKNLGQIIQEADQKMYQQKQAMHAAQRLK